MGFFMSYKFERVYNEQSGQLQRRDGKQFDFASFMELKKVFDSDVGTFTGSLYQSSWRGSIPTNTTLFFSQDFSSVDLIRGLTYNQRVKGALLEFQVIVGATPGSALETIEGYNLDRRYYASGSPLWTSDNPLSRVDGLTGGVIIDQWFEDTGGGGSKESSAPISQIGNIGLYDSTVPRAYSIENTSNTTAAEISRTWVWKEVIDFSGGL